MLRGQRRLSPDEVARYLFRKVTKWGRSSNVFLVNGSRLYLDVGSHPEYATPECDSLHDLVAHDKAGERIMEDLLVDAEERLAFDGIRGRVLLFKNNTDFAGNSYGCHENYLIDRSDELSHLCRGARPLLGESADLRGSGQGDRHSQGCFILPEPARRAHLGRPLLGHHPVQAHHQHTRRAHADADRFRRLHVIVGDSNMSEYTTFLKTGTCLLMLRMIEEPRVVLRDMTLENPIRALREISRDITCRRRVRLSTGREMSAVNIQSEYLERAMRFAEHHDLSDEEKLALTMWNTA